MLYPKDPKLTIIEGEKTIQIEWPWSRSSGVVGLVLAGIVLAIGVLLPLFPPDLADGTTRSLGDRWGIAIVFAVMGLPILYAGLAYLLNRTKIRADHNRIVVTHGPIPCIRPVVRSTVGAKQFFITTRGGSTQNSATTSIGELHMIDGENHTFKIAGNWTTQFAAHQVRHELQDFYGLEDLPVYGQTTDPAHPGVRQ